MASMNPIAPIQSHSNPVSGALEAWASLVWAVTGGPRRGLNPRRRLATAIIRALQVTTAQATAIGPAANNRRAPSPSVKMPTRQPRMTAVLRIASPHSLAPCRRHSAKPTDRTQATGSRVRMCRSNYLLRTPRARSAGRVGARSPADQARELSQLPAGCIGEGRRLQGAFSSRQGRRRETWRTCGEFSISLQLCQAPVLTVQSGLATRRGQSEDLLA